MNPENPYRYLRKQCKITQVAFGQRYGFSKIVMVYVEQGLYTAVSDRQNAALAAECTAKGLDARALLQEHYDTTWLGLAYERWQVAQREKNADRLAPVGLPFQSNPKLSPFLCYMIDTGGSTEGWCKLAKVPPATAVRYASGKTPELPDSIHDALLDAGWGPTYLDHLETEQDHWRDTL